MATRSFSALTKTKKAWPSSSIRARASSSNIGSIAKRLTFPIRGLLLEVGDAALQLVDELVDPGVVGGSARPTADRPAGDDELRLDDVGFGGAAVMFHRQLDDGVRAIVEHPRQPAELPLRIAADTVRYVVVLAPDDRPHRCREYTTGRHRGGSRFSPRSPR